MTARIAYDLIVGVVAFVAGAYACGRYRNRFERRVKVDGPKLLAVLRRHPDGGFAIDLAAEAGMSHGRAVILLTAWKDGGRVLTRWVDWCGHRRRSYQLAPNMDLPMGDAK